MSVVALSSAQHAPVRVAENLESSPSVSPAAPKTPVKPPYPPPAALPTQLGAQGVRFDFNQGARLLLPDLPAEGPAWSARLRDLDTGNVLFESENRGAVIASSKRFFVRFRMEVRRGEEVVLDHAYDARGREVIVQFPIGTLGDTLAWFPYAARFQERHGCRLTCAMSGLIIPLFRDAYPDIVFVTHEEMTERKLVERAYATYSLGLFFDDKALDWQPSDFRHVGLHKTAAYILGVDPAETRPRLAAPPQDEAGPPIAEPYVCIAVQSSSGCKMWNNPYGWREVCAHLRARGYRVICIDQKPVHGSGLLYSQIPNGAEDQTGDRPLTERARWLRHAKAFVGLSSGLAWLAHAAGTPVVLISGFTHPTNEFDTPFRVINWHACNSCWNDPALRFDHGDFMWCPRHKDTPRQFECTRLITPHHVNAHIDRALGIAPAAAGPAPPANA